jgi:hypothetical protein
VEYTRHVNPKSPDGAAKGSRPSRWIDGDPAKRISAASFRSRDETVLDRLRNARQPERLSKAVLHYMPVRAAIEIEMLIIVHVGFRGDGDAPRWCFEPLWDRFGWMEAHPCGRLLALLTLGCRCILSRISARVPMVTVPI